MKNNSDITWLYEQIRHLSTAIVYILMGVAANLVDHYRKGTFSKKQVIISGVMGVVTGYLAYQFCLYFDLTRQAGYIVPVATMAGEKIIPYIMDNALGWLTKFIEKKGGKDA